jgi:hypothetical protein
MFKNKTRTNNLFRSTTGTTRIDGALHMLHIMVQNLTTPARSIVPRQTLAVSPEGPAISLTPEIIDWRQKFRLLENFLLYAPWR